MTKQVIPGGRRALPTPLTQAEKDNIASAVDARVVALETETTFTGGRVVALETETTFTGGRYVTTGGTSALAAGAEFGFVGASVVSPGLSFGGATPYGGSFLVVGVAGVYDVTGLFYVESTTASTMRVLKNSASIAFKNSPAATTGRHTTVGPFLERFAVGDTISLSTANAATLFRAPLHTELSIKRVGA